jgi:hypothetical protein
MFGLVAEPLDQLPAKVDEAIAPVGLDRRPISMSYSVYSAGRDVVELAHWVNQVKYESL